MKKLASNLPLQDMIRSVVADATEKLASDGTQDRKVRNLISQPSAVETRGHEKVASVGDDFIEKLASACDYIASNVHQIQVDRPGVIESAIAKMAEEGSPVGPGKGPGSLEVSKSIGGTQSYKKDKPKTTDAAASTHGSTLSAGGLPGGKTQMDNDMHHAPGGGSIKPTAKYPEKGVLVAKTARARFIEAIEKQGSPAAAAKALVLQKLAGEDVLKANISASRNANPLAGMGGLTTTEASQSSPSQAGDPGSGYGNQGRRHIASNSGAIGYTKGDAKGPQKTQLKEVLEEPALNSSTDSTLKQNLRNTGSAGVKIAAARQALQKIAQGGCQCEGSGECTYCQMKSAVRAKSEKTANAQMGYGSGGGMSAMADAGASADGCQCGGTGECRVCKLKAALAAAKAEAGVVPGDGMMGGMPTQAGGDVPPSGGMY